MDWREELRRLDDRFANGEITANEYRRHRDELLAEASGSSAMAPWRSTNPGGKPEGAPIPRSAAVESPSGEMTQTVGADDRTVATPVGGPTHSAGAGDTTRGAPTIPPREAAWARPVPPPAGPAPGAVVPRAPVPGELVFAAARPQADGRGRAMLVALATIVVLALAGGAVWWFALRNDGGTQATPASTPAAQPSPQPRDVESSLPRLPGQPSANDSTMPVERAVQLKLIHPDEAAVFGEHGAESIIFRGSTGKDIGYAVLVVKTKSATDAAATTEGELAYLRATGFVEGSRTGTGNLAVQQRTDGSGTVYRVVYQSGDHAVRIGVSQKDNVDPARLAAELETVVKSVLDVLPANP